MQAEGKTGGVEETQAKGTHEVPGEVQKHTTLAVKQKAVMQATFKYRRWLQVRKDTTTCGTESIASIERSLPALRGPNASVANYEHRLQVVGDNLEKFYNESSYAVKRHRWDSQKAHNAEYSIITDKLLKMISGSAGKPRVEANKSIITVGLGQFTSKSRLSSLHSSFLSFFVSKARSLGYVVAGVNEYYQQEMPHLPTIRWAGEHS
ncbi:MAG: hypothetical protein J3Q66DRAFT_39280 [Benniella sp.]|nr:MAG: hypothetical protein J3Q66DRAFT_39280 [Benniella sp.]